MTSRLDSRQSRQRAALDQLSNSVDLRLDTILNLVNDELTMPLRLRASSPTPDRKIYIGSIEVQTLDGSTGTGRRRTIQPIGSLMPSFTAGYLELPSSSGGSITSNQGAGWFQSSYTLTVGSNEYIKIMIALSNQGKVVLTFGAPGPSPAAATMPIALSGSLPIGYITVFNTGGAIQPVTDLDIRQFTSGGGGGGAGASSKQVTQAAHGFVPGDVLYLNGSTYTKAQADVVATSEAVGIVSNVFASDLFELTEIGYISNASFTISGGGIMTAGEVYFLSPSDPGKLTASEPTNVGHVSKPMMIADGPTSGYVLNYRGSIVGGVNARSQVVLANNNSTPIQYVAPYDAGEIVGWVSLTNTTVSNSKKFYIQIQFAKNGPGTDYNVAYQVSGDTPPAGFAVNYSSDYIRITLPNISNLISASINYALNAPAVGVTLPLSVSGTNVVGGTPQVLGLAPSSTAGLTFTGSVNKTYTSVTGATTLNNTHHFVSASGASTYSVTLPTAVGVAGRIYIIKSNMNAGILLTVNTTSSQTIDGATSRTLTRYEALQVISNGSNWEVF